ncbi:hypothetical protein ACLOJK_017356 [Asimina triloba]
MDDHDSVDRRLGLWMAVYKQLALSAERAGEQREARSSGFFCINGGSSELEKTIGKDEFFRRMRAVNEGIPDRGRFGRQRCGSDMLWPNPRKKRLFALFGLPEGRESGAEITEK